MDDLLKHAGAGGTDISALDGACGSTCHAPAGAARGDEEPMEVAEHVDRSMMDDVEVQDEENAAEIDQVIDAIVGDELHILAGLSEVPKNSSDAEENCTVPAHQEAKDVGQTRISILDVYREPDGSWRPRLTVGGRWLTFVGMTPSWKLLTLFWLK